MLIYESKYFRVETPLYPLIDREDGGHITITPKKRIDIIQELEPSMAIELIRLIMVVGDAMVEGMKKNGVDIGRVNYQDNGNWGVFRPEGPYQHFHIYGRAKNAKIQKYGQTLYFPHKDEQPGFYETVRGLTEEDVTEITSRIHNRFQEARYSDSAWHLTD